MIVTFYSYKGGVGRSMAVANIACLLAEDPEHPQRVLLWDFDLEAPGLHRIFPPKQSVGPGFVDFAYRFVSKGQIENIEDCIQPSSVSGVDVLYAGVVDTDYCNKLQQIDWPALFTPDPTDPGPFFGPLLEQLAALDYDYILVDSRTGLSDHAGICAELLPDILVIVFRLSDQNLDGLAHLIPTIKTRHTARGRHDVKILPIASLVPPSASEIVRAYRDRVCEMFGVKNLDHISFDYDLMLEERIFCRSEIRKQLWPMPAIVNDYEEITRALRSRNELDTRTAMKRLRNKLAHADVESAGALLVPLLKRRPRLHELWRIFGHLRTREAKGEQRFRNLVNGIIDRDPDNSFARMWMADTLLREARVPEDDEVAQGKEHLDCVIGLDARHLGARRLLSRVCAIRGDLESSVRQLRECARLEPHNAQIKLDLATMYLRRGRDYFGAAIEEFEEVRKSVEKQSYLALVYLYCFVGSVDRARDELETYIKDKENWQRSQLFRAHFDVMVGDRDKATRLQKQCLSSAHHPASNSDRLNWAELLLCMECFDGARSLLQAARDDDDQEALLGLVNYVEGVDNAPKQSDLIRLWERKLNWNFLELILFRERLIRDESPLAKRVGIVEVLLQRKDLSLISQPEAALGYSL